MTGVGRILSLTVRFVWASKVRFALLTLIAAVAMAVFMIVEELSHLSTEDLNQAIVEDAGRTGTYAIEFSSALGSTSTQLTRQVNDVVAPFADQPLVMIETMPDMPRDCPPATLFGTGPVYIVRGSVGEAIDPSVGVPIRPGAEVCLGGQAIPATQVRQPTRSELADWLGVQAVAGGSDGPGGPIIVDPAYERFLQLNDASPTLYRFLLVTGRPGYLANQIKEALSERFADLVRSYGMSEAAVFDVSRVDTSDAGIKAAAAGVRLVYGVIGWGILALGALGLLVAEIIVVRDRSWFFGLARALGGRGSHIAALIFVDVLLVLISGTILAGVIIVALQPIAASFAESTFQVHDVSFLRPELIPQLILGEFLVLIAAGAWPALKAVRQDPLDVLEPRSL